MEIKKLIKALKKATLAWGSKARRGHLSKSEAWAALHTTISAKLKYPLPACTLTAEECNSIMWPALQGGLPKCGISACMATAIRDGPPSSGGGGMLSIFHFQGTSRTAMIVENCYKQYTTGKFI